MTSDLQILAEHADDGEAFWFLNALSIVKLSGKQTGGAFALIEDRLPAGRGTPYHVHQREDESFFSGSNRFTAGPGTTVFLPRGIPHGFRADTAGRVLILTTPSGFDDFVRDAGEPAGARVIPEPKQPDVGKLVAVAAKYGIEILGPLPE